MVFRKRKTRATSALVPKKPKVDRKKDLESAKEISRMGYIRKLMAERFVTSETGITIEELLTQPEFRDIDYKIAENWSYKDSWTVQRRELQNKIKNNVHKAIIDEVTQDRLNQLRMARGVKTAYDKVGFIIDETTGEIEFKLEPKSLESWLAGRVKLDEHIQKMQKDLANILPETTANAMIPMKDSLPMSLKPEFTEEEHLKIALLMRDLKIERDKKEREALEQGEEIEEFIEESKKEVDIHEVLEKLPKPKKKPPILKNV